MNKNPAFAKAYQQLNPSQKQAVDTIDGPVMVVAGPGTGKTQLLSMRVANILHRTDAVPSNILCLTFTESAATAMRKRLVSLMGQDAYKVAIHTFHSFGTEVINHHPEYFYRGAHFRPADELSSYEVLEPIFDQLPHSNPLASTMNGEFTALRDAQFAIANLKKAGLTPDELLKILDHNDAFIAYAEPILAHAFNTPRFTKKNIADCQAALSELAAFQPEPMPIMLTKPLAEICQAELERACEEAVAGDSTQPLTAWRNRWLERNHQKEFVFKDRARSKKLRALAEVYQKYLLGMQERELFDFDDMILRVVHALEYFAELRYNLQEQYHYILVDEFQDTNGAQLRLLQNLTNNQVNAGRPNILVVGDDDQAIYAFQGAEIGTILQFRELFTEPVVITLKDNYRSTEVVLQWSRAVITQGKERLEVVLEEVDKTLVAHNKAVPTTSELHQFVNPTEEYQWITQQIKQLVHSGTPPNEIAILGRNHKQLLEVLPHLRQANLAINYERRNNVLEAGHIRALTLLARVIVALGEQRYDIADSLLPELLSQKFWGLSTKQLWRLSLDAFKQRKFWLELMLDREGTLKRVAEFLIIASHEAQHEPLETMLDRLIGSVEAQVPDTEEAESDDPHNHSAHEEEFTSPLRAYYFNAKRLEQNPAEYLTLLSNLNVIRRRLREYRPDESLSLNDFVDFIDLHQKAKIAIVDTADHSEDGQAIGLMTAHKAKGLEFDAVFVLSCQEDIWGARTSASRRTSSIRFPNNLPIEPAGQTDDDCLRLFFVAMTRARRQLYLCAYQTDGSGKESLLAAFLSGETFNLVQHSAGNITGELLQTLEPTWQLRHSLTPSALKQTLLAPQLKTYQLSVTHLNNFLDVTTGGPQAFLLQNLLRFPQAMGLGAVFGSAIHAVLQRAHVHLSSSGDRRPLEDIMHDFELQLQNARLNQRDFSYLLEKGSDVLPVFLAQRYDSFTPTQQAEFSFFNQGVVLNEARLTGTIDLLEVHKAARTITVTDYKTGKPANSWRGGSDYEKIKLHKYRQQLMMYKLLVEHSRNFGGQYSVDKGVIEFVEADASQHINCLELPFDKAELERFTQLLQVVWRHIMQLDLPDITRYPTNYKGILAFEDDLLTGQA